MKKLTQAPENLLSLVRPGQVVMYSKATCPYCVRAKGVFNKIQVAFEFIEVDEVPVDPNELKKLHAASGIKTYPNIWIGDRPIGGCSDLISLISRGKLSEVLDEKQIGYDHETLFDLQKGRKWCNIF